MLIFIFFALLYGLANLYFFFSLTSLLGPGTMAGVVTGIAVVILAISPTLVHIYSFRGNEKILRIFRFSYLWLSFLMLFFPAGLLLDLYNMVIARILSGNSNWSVVSDTTVFFVAAGIATGVNAYGMMEARNLRVERLKIKSRKLPGEADKITIVHISDLHLGLMTNRKMLETIISAINNAKPDLILSTGDLVDGVVWHINHYANQLNDIKSRYGKFAVLGNHEVYGGLKHSIRFIKESGFRLLRNECITVNNMINIAGVDDIIGRLHGRPDENGMETKVLGKASAGLYTILMKHRSAVNEDSLGLFDLQLSGHTHKGQIFPMNIATMFLFEHHSGFKKLPEGSAIYVSRGAGTAGPAVRFLSKPEITIIEITREQAQS